MLVRDRYPKTTCRNCKAEVACESNNHNLPHGGFCLDLTGHYGGFTDDIEGDFLRVVLCHDCSLAVARALPGVFEGGGYHSMFYDEEHTSCCEFAWSVDKSDDEGRLLIGDGKGGWVPREEN